MLGENSRLISRFPLLLKKNILGLSRIIEENSKTFYEKSQIIFSLIIIFHISVSLGKNGSGDYWRQLKTSKTFQGPHPFFKEGTWEPCISFTKTSSDLC